MSKANSTRPPVQGKPEKPYPDFPLFAHATGRWAKKIRGRQIYFGPWSDPNSALAKYLEQKDALHSGVTPVDTTEALTVFRLCGKFLTTKKRMLEANELSIRSFNDYAATCKRLVKAFGKSRLVSDLRPDDFERLKTRLSKTWGPVRIGNEINKTRIVFNYGIKSGLIERAIVYGEGFRRPSKKTLRKHRAAQGPKMFEADEIKAMLAKASQPLKSMIMLACNVGYGNSDIGTLPLSTLDLDTAWINHARPKTGIARKAPLWPETVDALREWLGMRPEPKKAEHANLVFVTVQGDSWAKETSDNPLSKEMRKLMDKLKINGHRNFYCLRHTFQTIGDDARDFIAVRKIMGHASSDIADEYRERVSDERLQAVVQYVHDWVFGPKKAKEETKPGAAILRLHTA